MPSFIPNDAFLLSIITHAMRPTWKIIEALCDLGDARHFTQVNMMSVCGVAYRLPTVESRY